MKIGQKVYIMDSYNRIQHTEYEVTEIGKRNSENDGCVKLNDQNWYFSAFCIPSPLAEKYRKIFQDFFDEEEALKLKKTKTYNELAKDKHALEL
jgi:hypothetical protein